MTGMRVTQPVLDPFPLSCPRTNEEGQEQARLEVGGVGRYTPGMMGG
jgi:hypothetical protein